MVIKILGGKKASIRYQLKNPTARILHGDPAVTQRLIDGSNFSQKYCGIVLSFEENITAETESAILDDFRLLLRGGLEEDALDILAVGHADKIHPTTKAMRPDYHITAVETDLRTASGGATVGTPRRGVQGRIGYRGIGLTETATGPCLSDDPSHPSFPATQCAPLG